MFTQKQLRLIHFCAVEVDRQEDAPRRVSDMLHAWNEVAKDIRQGRSHRAICGMLTTQYVQYIALKTQPDKGVYRAGPVVIHHRAVGPSHTEIPRLMGTLFAMPTLNALTPLQVYIEFEKIHPFSDGNGRVGLIIFNALNGSIETPLRPNVGNVFA